MTILNIKLIHINKDVKMDKKVFQAYMLFLIIKDRMRIGEILSILNAMRSL